MVNYPGDPAERDRQRLIGNMAGRPLPTLQARRLAKLLEEVRSIIALYPAEVPVELPRKWEAASFDVLARVGDGGTEIVATIPDGAA